MIGRSLLIPAEQMSVFRSDWTRGCRAAGLAFAVSSVSQVMERQAPMMQRLTTAMTLFDLPSELHEQILVLCDPIDVANASQTCQHLHKLIYGSTDDAIWRGLYLAQPVDDPRKCVAPNGGPRPPIQWKQELQHLTRAQSLINSHSIGRPGEIGTILQTLLNLATYVPPLSDKAFPSSLSKTLVWLPVKLRHGWLDLVEQQLLATHERQMVARFHTYFGLTQNDLKKETLVLSRAFVYNMRNYSYGNEFGPFMEDGRVNWAHVRAIHHIVSMQVIQANEAHETDPEKYEYAVYPMSLPFIQVTALDSSEELVSNDWAGVTGDWIVSFCFCDHRELLVFNDEVVSPGIPEDTSIFQSNDFQEIFRAMTVEMRVLRTEEDPDHPDKPIIFFAGVMKDFNNSVMNGKIRMGSDGFVRWRFVSGEQSNAIWSSEGVQIGGLRSSFGVLGSWTTVFHDPDDPVGPFWLRKVEKSSTVIVSVVTA